MAIDERLTRRRLRVLTPLHHIPGRPEGSQLYIPPSARLGSPGTRKPFHFQVDVVGKWVYAVGFHHHVLRHSESAIIWAVWRDV